MMYNVLIADRVSDEAIEIFRADPEVTYDLRWTLANGNLEEIISGYDALIVRSESKVTKAVIERASRLRIIGRAGVGLDNVDIPAATRKGIIVMNTPDGNTISAAEHTVAMMLAMARNIPAADRSMREGRWDRTKYIGTELLGKTLGVIGLGRIGSEVAKRAAAFGMRVLGYDPYTTAERAASLGIELAGLEAIYTGSDFITVHVPKTDETSSLIGAAELSRCKQGVRLINVARGGIIDEAALIAALEMGRVAGAALDVFEVEPLPADHPLRNSEKIVLTPHLGASTEEAQNKVAAVVARQIIAALKGGDIVNAVNIPSVRKEEWETLKPYHALSERLALFTLQLADAKPDRLHITYAGEAAALNVQHLTRSILKTFLEPALGESVNLVNAAELAKERDIEVIVSTNPEAEDHSSMISIEVSSSDTRRTVSGTLIHDSEPRIVGIDEYRVDIAPAGNLLIFFNRDMPGVVGRIGTILGSSGVNIASMTNGRLSPGGEAASVFNLDTEISPETLTQIAQVPGLRDVRAIKL